MASKGSGMRLAVLGVLVVILVGIFALVKMRGSSPDIQTMVLNGDLLGKNIDEATDALGVQPEVLPNEPTDSPSTKNYRFTVSRGEQTHRVRVREQAGRVTAATLVDEQDKPLDIKVDSP